MEIPNHVIYFCDDDGPAFYRDALQTVMRASKTMFDNYGKWADIIKFRGSRAKKIYDNFMSRKYNLGAVLLHEDADVDEIMLEYSKKVKVQRGDVIRGIGFEYKIERDVVPEVRIVINFIS